jgi:hypothetical protein
MSAREAIAEFPDMEALPRDRENRVGVLLAVDLE